MNIIKYTAISAFLFVSSNATCNTHSNCAPSDLSYEGYSQCASTDSYANSNGPYAGIEGGILQNITRINNSVGIVHGDDNKLAIYPSATKIQPLKGTGDIFIGYFFHRRNFTIDVELSAILKNLNISKTDRFILPEHEHTVNLKTKIKNTVQFAFDFKPGYIVMPGVNLYGIVGATFNKVTVNYSEDAVLRNSNTDLKKSSEQHKNMFGMRAGLGIEKIINHNWAIRAQSVYTAYQPLKTNKSYTLPEQIPYAGDRTFEENTTLLYTNPVHSIASHRKIRLSNWSTTIGVTYRIPA